MQPTIHVRILDNRFPELRARAPQKAGQLVRVLANEGRNKAIMLIHDSPPTGRTYTRGSISHTASSPGNPPRTDTGNLIGSITVQNAGPFQQEISVGADYGPHLEFGTEDMEARPFMGPMAEWLESQVSDIFDGWLE